MNANDPDLTIGDLGDVSLAIVLAVYQSDIDPTVYVAKRVIEGIDARCDFDLRIAASQLSFPNSGFEIRVYRGDGFPGDRSDFLLLFRVRAEADGSGRMARIRVLFDGPEGERCRFGDAGNWPYFADWDQLAGEILAVARVRPDDRTHRPENQPR
jgi:hypothetical protein